MKTSAFDFFYIFKKCKLILFVGLIIILNSCTNYKPTPKGELYERGGVSVVLSPGHSSEAYFSDADSRERFCRAPAPDFGVAYGEGFNIGSSIGVTENIGEDVEESIVTLGGRNPAVLIARELLYRACELSSNLRLTKSETLQVYVSTMHVITNISKNLNTQGVQSFSASSPDTRLRSAELIKDIVSTDQADEDDDNQGDDDGEDGDQ